MMAVDTDAAVAISGPWAHRGWTWRCSAPGWAAMSPASPKASACCWPPWPRPGQRHRASLHLPGGDGGARAADPPASAAGAGVHLTATAALAAACGLPMLGLHADDDGKREMIAAYAAAAPSGQPPAGHIAAVVAYVADTREQAQRLLRRELPRWLAPGLAGYRPVDGRPGPARDPGAYAGLLCDIHPVGAAADCIDSMAATIERTGIRHLLCMVEGAGDPARTRENIARLGAEVLPVLRQRFGGGPGHVRAASGAQVLREKPGST